MGDIRLITCNIFAVPRFRDGWIWWSTCGTMFGAALVSSILFTITDDARWRRKPAGNCHFCSVATEHSCQGPVGPCRSLSIHNHRSNDFRDVQSGHKRFCCPSLRFYIAEIQDEFVPFEEYFCVAPTLRYKITQRHLTAVLLQAMAKAFQMLIVWFFWTQIDSGEPVAKPRTFATESKTPFLSRWNMVEPWRSQAWCIFPCRKHGLQVLFVKA